MKISKPLKKQKLAEKISGNKKGVALVLVLTVMSLATIMILTFFSLATSEHKSSATYSQGLQAQQVAEQAVNLVISQIRAATAKADVAWASQPGAIRTWLSDSQFNVGYKLYSDDVLQETSEAALNNQDFKDAQNWAAVPSEFVDLNEPVIRGEKVYFPVVDPSARDLPKWPGKIGGEDDDAGVEGFDFNFDPAHSISPGDYDRLVKAKNSVGHLALPVRWIYQLADGTLGTIKGTAFQALSGNRVTPKADNQIVGRFAFWADDETAKLNLNVHAGGLAWDTPRAGGDMDMDMARFQPLQHEWQRYPGHPATTHLVPVLAPGVLDIVRNKNAMELIFDTIPRIVRGGSESGTRKANPSDKKERDGLIPDQNPLFPSVDEYMMAPDRKPNSFPQANGRRASEDTMMDMMERVRFFLTTNSRAPETTLFNTPRIAVWPIHKTNLTAFDRMIEFCSTINQKKYIFERMNSDSATDDYNNIPRNKELFRYLAKLTDSNIPGVGAGFNDKYKTKEERHQILTQIFDYIRCTNLHDDSLFGQDWESALQNVNSNQHITYTNPRRKQANPNDFESGIHKGHGQVTPIEINEDGVTTKGFGRFYTLSEVAIHVICVADGGTTPTLGGPPIGPRNPGYSVYGGGPPQEVDEAPMFSNFPPLPPGATLAEPSTWPDWLKGKESDPNIAMAFEPNNWNWNLMYNLKEIPPNGQFVPPNKSDVMHLEVNEKLVQALFVFNMFCPSMGWVPVNPDMSAEIKWDSPPTFTSLGARDGNGKEVTFLGGSDWTWSTNDRQTAWHHRNAGGPLPFTYIMASDSRNANQIKSLKNPQEIGIPTGRLTPLDPEYNTAHPNNTYPFITRPFRISSNALKMTAGNVTFKIYSHGTDTNGVYPSGQLSAPQASPELVQTITVAIPALTNVPSPSLSPGRAGHINEFKAKSSHPLSPMHMWSLGIRGAQPNLTGRLFRLSSEAGLLFHGGDVVQSVGVVHGDVRMAAIRKQITGEEVFGPHFNYGENQMAHDMALSTGDRYAGAVRDGSKQILPGLNYAGRLPSTVIGNGYTGLGVNKFGDFDNNMGLLVDGCYINKPDEGNTHSLYKKTNNQDPNAWDLRRNYGDFPYFVRDYLHEAGSPSYFSPNRITSGPGMFGSLPSGALLNTPWQTLLFRPSVPGTDNKHHPGAPSKTYDGKTLDGGKDPADHYLLDLFWMPVVEPYAISEPLSTAGKVNLNYQILPFRNVKRNSSLRGIFRSELMVLIPTKGYNPANPTGNARGNDKQNGPSVYTTSYKHESGRGRGWHWRDKPNEGFLQGKRLRAVIQEPRTLDQFQERFDYGKIFKSASEICEVHLVPQQVTERMGITTAQSQLDTYTPTISQMENGKFWKDHAAIGDNARERPYGNIYSRVTTKSNTFKVHYRGQVLKQGRRLNNDYSKWDPELDSVVGEYRGSSIVERYLDPNSTQIIDYATVIGGQKDIDFNQITANASYHTIDDYHRFRIVNPTRFAP